MADGLLGFLGDLGQGLLQGITATSAGYAASQGRPAMLEAMQQQRQRENLLNQLQTMSQQEMAGPFGETLKRQLQFGDIQGAQRTLINLPRYKEIQTTLENPQLGLAPETRSAIASLSALDPELGARALQQNIREAEVGKRKQLELKELFKQRSIVEEKKAARQEAKLPGNIVLSAIENKTVDPTDVAGVVGILQAAGVKLPTNENEARIYASRILSSPKIKALIPQEQKKSWTENFKSFFSPKPQAVPAPAPVPTARVQSTQEQKMRRLQELLEKQGR